MGDCNRRIRAKQQLHHWLAHQNRAADNQGLGTANVAQTVPQEHHYPKRSAGDELCPSAREQSRGHWGEAIDILGGIDDIEDRFLADVHRHGKLDENSVYRRIAVQCADPRQQLRFRRRFRQTEFERVKAAFARVVAFAAYVHLARRIVAHEHDGEAGDDAVRGLQFRALDGNAGTQPCRRRFAVDDRRAHAASSVLFRSAGNFALS